MPKGSKRGSGQLSLWQRIRRNPSQALFYLLGLLIVVSMILSLVIVALPEPQPAPAPLPLPALSLWLPAV